jgi:hypothetical protein
MIENIRNQIYVNLEMLFAEATACDLANDFVGYSKAVNKIATIAKALNIETEVISTKINVKQ